MGSNVVGDPNDIDAEWMSQALEEAGVADGATVTDIEFAGYIGTGQMSRNGRFRLTWDQPEGRPASVVGKFPSDDDNTRVSAFESGTYLGEYSFYAHIAKTVDVCTPQCWVARMDEEQQSFVLIMEDLASSVQGDQFTGSTVDEVALALEQAAGLHAPRWGDPSLASLPALQPVDEARAEMVTNYYAATYQPCLDRLGSNFTPEVSALITDFKDIIGPWCAGSGSPHTLVHGDFRPDNFLLGQTPDAPPLAVVDWQTIHKGIGLSDVAYLIGGAMDQATRQANERDLVEHYRQLMVARGVELSAEQAWRDYRWGTLHGVVISVIAAVLADVTERGDQMLTLMATRHAQHAIDLDALTLVA